jgi:hypothetical protein
VGIEIDLGDGVVEKHRIATTSTFDQNGRPAGISLLRALEIAGIIKAPGEDLATVTPGVNITPAIRNSYGTVIYPDGVERLTRVRDIQNDRSTTIKKRLWVVLLSNPDVSPNQNFSEIHVFAGNTVQLWFTSDFDNDGLFAREEYLYGSKDDDTDSDGDGLGDFAEVRTGWTVNRIPGLPYKVFSDPARPDSDLDGLSDSEELTHGTDPHRADTDGDGIPDKLEIQGPLEVVLYDGDADETNDVIWNVVPYQQTGERIVAGPDGVLTTVRAGDDLGGPAFGFIVPGPDGIFQSVVTGDDFLQVAHARLFATDPLNRDTDLDAPQAEPCGHAWRVFWQKQRRFLRKRR